MVSYETAAVVGQESINRKKQKLDQGVSRTLFSRINGFNPLLSLPNDFFECILFH